MINSPFMHVQCILSKHFQKNLRLVSKFLLNHFALCNSKLLCQKHCCILQELSQVPQQTSFSRHYYSHENFTYPSLCKSHTATLLRNRAPPVMWQEGETKIVKADKDLDLCS